MKKIGLLALALVLAVGMLGIGYASWTDQVVITGTVETGTLDVDVVYVSYVEVWKDYVTEEAVTVAYADNAAGDVVFGPYPAEPPADGLKVAYTTAEIFADDEVKFTFNNLFPSEYFIIDVKMHCLGSVPVKLNAVSLTSDLGGDWVDTLLTSGDIGYDIYRYTPGATPDVMGTIGAPYYEGNQLEYCDWIILILKVHIPQDDTYQDLTVANGTEGNMTMTVDFIQWNKY